LILDSDLVFRNLVYFAVNC